MVVTELAVFLLGEIGGGVVAPASLSFDEFLESQENALVSFLVGPGGGTGASGGDARPNLEGESVVGGGDHGIAGSVLAMLLSDIVRGLGFG
jgi:hypothetical protein